MVKMRVSTANLFTSNPTDLIFSYGKRNIICVKEDCFAIPKFLTGTFLNAVIMFNFKNPLVSREQLNHRRLK